MGSKTSKANKEFQAVIPYTPSSRPNPKRKKNATQPRRPTVAPALTKENSGISVDSDDQEQAKPPANKRIPLRSPSICEDVGWVPMSSNFDFSNTEGQNRRDLIASCSEECSMITSFLFVGGSKVANSKEILNQHNITRIINCSLCAVDNVFESDGSFTYLSLNMLDGRQDDISWFVGEVINFIELSRKDKCNVLLHCEKGISRSCSFAIAYVMWASGCQWKTAFDYVRERRPSCSPNTGFTCNLIEFDELIYGDSRQGPLMFRLAKHLPHDEDTPVLKLIRNSESRNIIRPHFSFLNSDGIFVIRPSQTGRNEQNILYIWRGKDSSEAALKAACALAEILLGVFSVAETIEVVTEGSESDNFQSYIEPNSNETFIDYDDLFRSCSVGPVPVEPKYFCGSRTTAMSWTDEGSLKVPSILQVNEIISGKFLLGIDKFITDPSVVLYVENASSFPKLNIMPEFKMNTSKVTPTSTPTRLNNGNGKEDEIFGATAVISPVQATNTITEEDGADDQHDDKATVAASRNKADVPKHEQLDVHVLTPLNPATKESVPGIGLRIPVHNNDTSKDDAVIQVVAGNKDIIRSKPVLFQCFLSPDDGSVLWQHMGMYDDDDLLDECLLFLLCPGAPHHLWKGSAYELPHLAAVNSVTKFEALDDEDKDKNKDKQESDVAGTDNDACADQDSSKLLQYAMESVELGEVPLPSKELKLIFSSTTHIRIQLQNEESEEWWDAFNNGM